MLVIAKGVPDECVVNNDEFSISIKENEQGIIVDVWIRHGMLINTDTYWKDDFFKEENE